jgi:hypothetical protein
MGAASLASSSHLVRAVTSMSRQILFIQGGGEAAGDGAP